MSPWKSMVCVAGAVFASCAFAADKPRAALPGTSAQEDRAYCDARPDEDRRACLREAGAAKQAARRGQLDEGLAASYDRNRLARCGYLPEADRELCVRRMNGEGTATGSVESGGIYRELTVTVPADEGSPSTGRTSSTPSVNSVTGH